MDTRTILTIIATLLSFCARPIARMWDYLFDMPKTEKDDYNRVVFFTLGHLLPLAGIIFFTTTYDLPVRDKSFVMVIASLWSAIAINFSYYTFKLLNNKSGFT